MKFNIKLLTSAILCTCLSVISLSAASPGDVVFNEIAWRTQNAQSCAWIELYNTTDNDICLEDWKVVRIRNGAEDTSKEVVIKNNASPYQLLISSTIKAGDYYLMQRIGSTKKDPAMVTSTSTPVMDDFRSSYLYQFLAVNGEHIILKDASDNIIDELDCSAGWFAGDNDKRYSMEKVKPELKSNERSSWKTYRSDIVPPYMKDHQGGDIYGTPRQQNSVYGMVVIPPDMPTSHLKVEDSPFFPLGEKTPNQAQIAYRNLGENEVFVTITIYNTHGYPVRNLLKYTAVVSDGWDYADWDGADDYGEILPMGIYIVHMKMEEEGGGAITEKQAPVVLGRKF